MKHKLVKGSDAAKKHMARLRAMRGRGKIGGSLVRGVYSRKDAEANEEDQSEWAASRPLDIDADHREAKNRADQAWVEYQAALQAWRDLVNMFAGAPEAQGLDPEGEDGVFWVALGEWMEAVGMEDHYLNIVENMDAAHDAYQDARQRTVNVDARRRLARAKTKRAAERALKAVANVDVARAVSKYL